MDERERVLKLFDQIDHDRVEVTARSIWIYFANGTHLGVQRPSEEHPDLTPIILMNTHTMQPIERVRAPKGTIKATIQRLIALGEEMTCHKTAP